MAKKKTNNKILKPFEWFRDKSILFVVFITGACVLIIEVSATRILSPYFGNTIFTVSSVISVVLAALSFGYYFGGKLADKNPDENIFYRIITFGGVSVLLMQFVITKILPIIVYNLPIVSGPLISSIMLFSIPSYLLGILSPFAIKLSENKYKKRGIGRISGEIFFTSTLGSIFGSLITGFYLIPKFGLNSIMLSVGVVLIILGLKGFQNSKKKFNLILLTSFITFLLAFLQIRNPDSILFNKDGIYGKNVVYDGVWEGKPARFLAQDRSLSSAKYLDDDELAFEYTKYYQLYKLFNDNPQNVLFIGGGAYITPQVLLNEVADIEIDVTEIEPILHDLSKKYFDFVETGGIHNHIVDGRRYLHDTNKKYDIIFSDVYSSIYSIPSHFTTKEFFNLARNKLYDDGIFIANIIGSLSRIEPSFLFSEYKTFQSVFPKSYLFAVESPTQLDIQNTIFLGVNSDKEVDIEKIIKSQSDTFFEDLGNNLVDIKRFDLSNYKLLTDNYSSADYYTVRLLTMSGVDESVFNSSEALSLIEQQLSYGERYVGSVGHDNLSEMVETESETLSDKTLVQKWKEDSIIFTNIISQINPEYENRLLLATHYDTKTDIPGANDGASGTAVLLELMRVLKHNQDKIIIGVDFVFFDGEEGIEGKEWQAYGSNYFADHIDDIYENEKPESAVIIDMICDKNLDIYREANSVKYSKDFVDRFWKIATEMYPNRFHQKIKYAIEDDHVALNNVGIPSMLVIDYDYPYFHTTADTINRCSEESLEVIGNTLLKYVYSYRE